MEINSKLSGLRLKKESYKEMDYNVLKKFVIDD